MECAVCHSKNNLMRCAGCKGIFYCSPEHQKQHWKEHKPTCKMMTIANTNAFVKEIITPGNGTKPELLKPVTVNYKGYFVSGKVFDANNGFTFTLGAGEVIKGWDQAVAEMTIGEKAKVFISSEFAYGKYGAGSDIPPNMPLIFEIELLH